MRNPEITPPPKSRTRSKARCVSLGFGARKFWKNRLTTSSFPLTDSLELALAQLEPVAGAETEEDGGMIIFSNT